MANKIKRGIKTTTIIYVNEVKYSMDIDTFVKNAVKEED